MAIKGDIIFIDTELIKICGKDFIISLNLRSPCPIRDAMNFAPPYQTHFVYTKLKLIIHVPPICSDIVEFEMMIIKG